MRLPDYVISDGNLRTAPHEKLERMQDERLRTMVQYVYERSPFWRGKLEAAGVDPQTFRGLSDLASLPTCDKKELQHEQEEHGWLGRYTCSDRSDWARLFATSGTTGRPLRRVLSHRDWQYALDLLERQRVFRPDDVVMMTVPTDGVMGGGAMAAAAFASGALVITGGKWSTERKIDTIVGMRVTSVVGSLSYVLHMTEVAAELGVDLATSGVRRITCFGEPGLAAEETAAKISERFGGAVVSDGYGLTEIFGLGYSCAFRRSVHLPEDMVLVECLRPGSNDAVAPGELGELVFTNLVCDTQPLIRYRSADLGRLSDGSPCECGDTNVRIENSVEGRVDDMIWYHGANFFPSAVQSVVSKIDGIADDFYQIVLTTEGDFPKLSIRVERTGDGDSRAIASEVGSAIKGAVGVNAAIEVLPAGALPRPEAGAKFRHVVRIQK